jgi:GAF domain-containing protein
VRGRLAYALESALRKENTRLNKLQTRVADRRAQAIMTITRSIQQGLPTEDLFSTVVQEVISLLNCDRATMWLLTADRAKLWSMVAPYPPKRDSSLIRLEVPISDKSLSGSCVLNDEVKSSGVPHSHTLTPTHPHTHTPAHPHTPPTSPRPPIRASLALSRQCVTAGPAGDQPAQRVRRPALRPAL